MRWLHCRQAGFAGHFLSDQSEFGFLLRVLSFHGDICGPMQVSSLGAARFYVAFKADDSGYHLNFCVSTKIWSTSYASCSTCLAWTLNLCCHFVLMAGVGSRAVILLHSVSTKVFIKNSLPRIALRKMGWVQGITGRLLRRFGRCCIIVVYHIIFGSRPLNLPPIFWTALVLDCILDILLLSFGMGWLLHWSIEGVWL